MIPLVKRFRAMRYEGLFTSSFHEGQRQPAGFARGIEWGGADYDLLRAYYYVKAMRPGGRSPAKNKNRRKRPGRGTGAKNPGKSGFFAGEQFYMTIVRAAPRKTGTDWKVLSVPAVI